MARVGRSSVMRQRRLASAGNPLISGGRARTISRAGGGYAAPGMGGWNPRRIGYGEEGRQRDLLAKRAADLVANDPHACSLIETISINTVGPGLWPQSKPNFKRLGIEEEQARDIAEQAEWEFELWNNEADARGISDFYGIQFQNLWSMLVKGEFLNLPLMLSGPEHVDRRYRLALQVVDPDRIKTPGDLSGDPNVRDGVRLGKLGNPAGYFIANPSAGLFSDGAFDGVGLSSMDFVELPPMVGHRHVAMHRYFVKEPEQVRGVSILAPAMGFFRNLADYLDYELAGAIVAASFPVFIEKTDPYSAYDMPGTHQQRTPTGDTTHYREFAPGTAYYGNSGEKPHILKGDRPGNSFEVFVEKVLRGAGAAANMPYELVAKDFSKTNYSSARAALQEAWRVFELYQDWLVNRYCRQVWEMFFEEAVLRGRIALPMKKTSPGFYDYRAEWCNCTWVGPERTNVDPVKEMTADIMGLNSGIITLADIAAKRNKDWEAQLDQRKRERDKLGELGMNQDPPTVKEAKDLNELSKSEDDK